MIKKIAFLFVFILSSCSLFKSNIPQPKREFRGVWIATVVNIDWPKNGNDSWEKQKTDYLHILDFYQSLNLNAVIVQIRAAGDAFYPSEYAPWSRFLTGKEGLGPDTGQDPLKWMIREAHSRGFEFHAWLNPYRATFDLNTGILAESHDFNQYPEWMFQYGKKFYYNPGIPEVQQHLVNIMEEVVTNYDVDALHFDDYFYPYKIKDEKIPDSTTYASYALPGQSIEDWRRSNVDSLIKNVHEAIQLKKPWVQFGISPFGVWKNDTTDPRGSATRAGQTTYEDLYADPLLWMEKQWIDYLVPQVYWSMDLEVASHKKIVDWWANDSINTNLYIGNAAYKIRNNADRAWNKKKELPNQLLLARKKDKINGNVFFSAKSLLNTHPDVVKYIRKKYYQNPVLTPGIRPGVSAVENTSRITALQRKNNFYTFEFDSGETYQFALVYTTKKARGISTAHPEALIDKIYLGGRNSFTLGKWLLNNKKQFAITFLNRYGMETEPIILNLNETDQYDTKE
ncbi:MAG: family 10 glycosylhydrolase [Eudoraea sp.]|nr:family 10 glycosylhydrolase [Eudoraea sp.]